MAKSDPVNTRELGGGVLEQLLNRIEAMLDCEAATLSELAADILPDQDRKQRVTRVSEWVRSRKRVPNGEAALRLHEWAGKKTLQIRSILGAKGDEKYSAAFREVIKRRGNE